jgi:hypothetical protein
MDKTKENTKYTLIINTKLQKANDQNIQNFLNNYKYYEEWPILKENTGKNVDLIISHKSTIPDLVIYNKVFNKNLCFVDANQNEKNYFPRMNFFIKFDPDEKLRYKDETNYDKNKKETENSKVFIYENDDEEDNKKNEEEEDEDDEAEENEEDEVDNEDKNQNIPFIDNNSAMSVNNSFYKEIEFARGGFELDKTNKKKMPNLMNQSDMNYFDNSVNYDEKNSSYMDSYLINNVNNIIDNKNEDISQIINNKNLDDKDISKRIKEIQNMYSQQIALFKKIENLKLNNYNNQALNELYESIIKIALFDRNGNIVLKILNVQEVFKYITDNVIVKNKKLDEYNVYILNTDEKIEGSLFYMSIIKLLRDTFQKAI